MSNEKTYKVPRQIINGISIPVGYQTVDHYARVLKFYINSNMDTDNHCATELKRIGY